MASQLINSLPICFALAVSVATYADNDKPSEYEIYQTLHVSISNHTYRDCARVNVKQPYGSLIEGTVIPYEIDKSDTATFIMAEGMATGPDVTVTYRCGNETFTVRAWQRQCWLAYGCDAHGEIISHTPGITLDEPVDTKDASRFWKEYGQVHFTVR